MSTNKLISIIVPVYNVENYIESCLDSISAQTYPEYEVIIVNDGSTDSSMSVIDSYLKTCPARDRVRTISQANGGLSVARNTGIKAAGGDYVLFLDSDDYLLPEALDRLYAMAVSEDSDIVISDYKEVDEYGLDLPENIINGEEVSYKEQLIDISGEISKELLLELLAKTGLHHDSITVITAWNKLIKKELIDKHLFKKGVIHEDEFWIAPLLLDAKSISRVNAKTYCYRIRQQSIMNTKKYDARYIYVIDAFLERIQTVEANGYDIQPFVNQFVNNMNMYCKFAFERYGLNRVDVHDMFTTCVRKFLRRYRKNLSWKKKIKLSILAIDEYWYYKLFLCK